MRITVLNTYDRLWGASIASMRICESLISVGAEVRFLVLQAVTPKPYMDVIEQNAFDHRVSQWLLFKEKAYLYFKDNPDTRNGNKRWNFAFSLSNSGRSVFGRKSIREAEILHLNWTNNAFLSFKNIQQLASTRKPIVWTQHDQWTFTGGCHYTGSCGRYLGTCGDCPFLRHPSENDLSNQQFLIKKALYASGNFHFTAPSRWMREEAKRSTLLKDYPVDHIPYPLNTDVFTPVNKAQARKTFNLPTDKKLLLFGSAKLNDGRKGFPYLYKALQRLRATTMPDLELVVYGFADGTPTLPDMPVHYVGMLKSDAMLAECYSACDLMALPTAMDNLPLTVAEALACGLPVVAFDVGGVGDLVESDFNGYLVPHGDDVGLAQGMEQIFSSSEHYDRLSRNARQRTVDRYAYPVIGKQYLALYETLIRRD